MQTIYLLSDPDTEAPRYVGVTKDLKKRFRQHLSGNSRTHCDNWIRSLLRQGLKPKVEVLERTEDHQRIDAEQAWILGFRIVGANLTNLTMGGEGNLGWKATSKTRIRMSVSGKRRWTDGEFKRKMSASHVGNNAALGYKHSAETREKDRLAFLGRHHTAETKAKIRAAKLGRAFSLEARAKMSSAKKGHKYCVGRILSAETKAKISASHIGKRLTSEHIAKLRAELQLYWKSKREAVV